MGKAGTKDSLTKSDIKRVCDILRRDDGVGAKDYIEQFSWLLFLKVFEGVEDQLKELEEAEGRKYKPVVDAEYRWSSWAKKDWKDKDELIHFINQKLFPHLKSLRGTREKDKIGEIFRELQGNRIRSPHNLLDVVEILDKIEKHHFQDTHLLSQVYEEILQAMGSEGGWSGEFYTPRPIIRLMVNIVDPKLGGTIFDPFVGSGGFLVESYNHLYEKSAKDVRAWRTLQTKTFYGQEKKPLPFLIGTMNLILHHILVPNIMRANTFMEDVHSISESSKMDVILTNPPFGAEESKTVQSNYPIEVGVTEGLALQYIMKRLKNGGRCGVILPEGNILLGGGAMIRIREELLSKFNVHTIISLPQGAFAQMGAGVKTNLIFFDKTGPTKEIWYGEVKGKFTKKKIIKDEDLLEIFEKRKTREVSENSWTVPIEVIRERGYDISPKNPISKNNDGLLPPNEIFGEVQRNQKEINSALLSLKQSINTKDGKSKFASIKLGDKNYFKVETGSTPKTGITEYWDGDIIWVTPKDLGFTVKDKRIYDSERKISKQGLENSSASPVPAGSIIISTRAPIGYVAIADTEMCFNQGCKAIVPLLPQILPEYLYYSILSAVDDMKALGKGSVFDEISKEKLESIEILLPFKAGKPDSGEQQRVAKELDKVFSYSQKISSLVEKQEVYLSSLKSSALIQVAVPSIFNIQQAIAHILKRIERGEMIIAKILYIAQAVYKIPLSIHFTAQNFGPYDTAVKKAVTAGLSPRNQFFSTRGIGEMKVLALGKNAEKILKYSNSALARRVNDYLDKMMPYYAASDSPSIERLATICKIIEDEGSSDESTIKTKLENWKPGRFTGAEISKTIAFIKSNGWDTRLLK
ncbi:MAG: N-6 DNA methylase [Patescibacteria group bacterium]